LTNISVKQFSAFSCSSIVDGISSPRLLAGRSLSLPRNVKDFILKSSLWTVNAGAAVA
jgi:hypothetical protein